jgi:hypothetical protein
MITVDEQHDDEIALLTEIVHVLGHIVFCFFSMDVLTGFFASSMILSVISRQF